MTGARLSDRRVANWGRIAKIHSAFWVRVLRIWSHRMSGGEVANRIPLQGLPRLTILWCRDCLRCHLYKRHRTMSGNTCMEDRSLGHLKARDSYSSYSAFFTRRTGRYLRAWALRRSQATTSSGGDPACFVRELDGSGKPNRQSPKR